jgi:DNA-directed RNA polymerase specialized sigma24 family protein
MKSKPRSALRRQADFQALYEGHSREVWALAYARWLNADLALDIMQEAFLRLWKQWQGGEEILNPSLAIWQKTRPRVPFAETEHIHRQP